MNKAILEEVIVDHIVGNKERYNCYNPYCGDPQTDGNSVCSCGNKRKEIEEFKVNVKALLSDERLSKPVVDVEPEEFNHEIKILPKYFKPKLDGTKTFEIRLNDRDYKVGDSVKLNEYNGGYTGRYVWGYIDYITCYEQKPRFVVFTHSMKNILSSVAPVEDWIDPDKAITGKTVLAWYKNSFDKKRVVRATYYEKYHLQVEDWDGIDEEWCDQAQGTFYIPEGWYETNEHDEKCIKIECDVLGWQKLPQPPTDKGE